MRIVGDYKNGNVWYLTQFGWAYIAEKHPEIVKRI
jgi:hypothetical protein